MNPSETIKEIYQSTHFNDRLFDRLQNSNLEKKQKNEIEKNLKKLLSTKTPRNKKVRIAVRLLKADNNFTINDYIRRTKYVGDEIWVIVQQRTFTTLLVGKSSNTSNPDKLKNRFKVNEVYYSPEDLIKQYQ